MLIAVIANSDLSVGIAFLVEDSKDMSQLTVITVDESCFVRDVRDCEGFFDGVD